MGSEGWKQVCSAGFGWEQWMQLNMSRVTGVENCAIRKLNLDRWIGSGFVAAWGIGG
jgi:hypothetical protein